MTEKKDQEGGGGVALLIKRSRSRGRKKSDMKKRRDHGSERSMRQRQLLYMECRTNTTR